MPAERLLRILDRLEREGTAGLPVTRLCDVCADVMDMSGAGIMLMAGDVSRGSICSSNPVSKLIEDLQWRPAPAPCSDFPSTSARFASAP